MEVQLVRRHRRGQQLQALRKRLVLRMDSSEDNSGDSRQMQLRVCVPCAAFEAVLLQICSSEIKAVRIKRRLMSIALVQGDRSFLLRFKDDVDALSCGERFMTVWGIDPTVETFAEDSGTQGGDQEEQELKQLTRQYLTNERFRSLVHQLHTKMEASTQVWEF